MELTAMRSALDRNLKIEWIWEPRIPRGYVTLLGAKGGTGKSGFALWLSGLVVNQTGGNVLYVDAENTLKHITTRIKAWGLAKESEKIYFFSEEDHYKNLESMFPGFSEISEVVKLHCFELIIIDSLTALAHSANLKEERDASYLMKELRDLARIANSGLLLLCHTKKPIQLGDSVITADDIAGSHALVDMARSVLLMSSDQQDVSKKTIRHGKFNFSAPAKDLQFTMSEEGLKDLCEVDPPPDYQILEAGSESAIYNNIGLQAAREGLSKREIRARVKAACPEKTTAAREMLASRVIIHLKEEHNYKFE